MSEHNIEISTKKKTEAVKIKNTSKAVNVEINQKTFKINFQNKIDYLLIVAKCHDNLFPIEYSGKFDLEYIKKVGLFRDYESIDECLFDIFDSLNKQINCSEDENLDLIISVPLPIKKYPEITFTLKMNKKNDSEKYNDLCEVISNMKNQKDKEIKELKEKIENLERLLQIKLESTIEDEKFEGTKFEIFTIGKDDYYNYFPKPNQYNKKANGIFVTLTLECNENDIQPIIDTFNNNKAEIKKILSVDSPHDRYNFELNIRSDKNIICVDLLLIPDEEQFKDYEKEPDYLFYRFINESLGGMMLYSSFITNKVKAKLKTEATLLDVFELKDEEKLDNLILNTKLDFEGWTLKTQIFMSFLILLFNYDKQNSGGKTFYQIVNDIFLSVFNGNCSYKIPNKEMFFCYEDEKVNLLSFLKDITFDSVNLFKDPKFRAFQKANYNKIKVGILGSPKFKVGFLGINFESPKNNEFIDKVLNDRIKKYEEK